jgi:predicted component of type VI protein secretion system
MPYIVITANGEELDRRELEAGIVIGRSPECDVAVRDILLSRRHVRIEADGRLWRLIDLGSKNGTHYQWKKIDQRILADGDKFRLGRTWLEFRSGAFEPGAAPIKRKPRIIRPADPHEALTGTVNDFVLERDPASQDDSPALAPRPADPTRIGANGAAGALHELSSSWESIVATASRPNRMARPSARPMPRSANGAPRPVMRRVPRPEPEVSLQATAAHVPFLEALPATGPKRPVRRRARIALRVTLGAGIVAALVLWGGWAFVH